MRRLIVTSGVLGGLLAGLVIALALLVAGLPLTVSEFALSVCIAIGAFIVASWATWGRWAGMNLRARQRVFARLAEGDLSAQVRGEGEPAEIRRLILSLRRALAQVQRVTTNLHRTSDALSGQARELLESARRQGSAVDRTLVAVADMGGSLGVAGKRVSQVDAFAQETTTALSEMTQRIEQVAEALSTLTTFARSNSEQVQVMGDRLVSIANSGDALLRFATEAEDFVALVEGSIDSVRRRAHETGQLALEVRETAERGEAQVRDSVQGIYRLEESVRGVAELVEGLGRRGREIARIVDVIQEVADQTNLLALNASIIAAQSGEHGRAFGVVAEEVRSLAERTGRGAREVRTMVHALRSSVEGAVTLVQDSREQARVGVTLGDRAAQALKEIRAISSRTIASIEATEAETERLDVQGNTVVEASRQVASRIDEVTRAAMEQATHGRELVRQTQEMARLAESANSKAAGQARVGRDLSGSVLRLTAAIDEIRGAHRVLFRADTAISEEVAAVREDANRVIRIGDGLSRTVEQLSLEANGLEAEVFRFRLPVPQRGGVLRAALHQHDNLEMSRGLDPLFTLDSQLVEITGLLYPTLLRSEDGVLVPGLAERWESDPSLRRFRFTLRQGLSFWDGGPLTTEHVKAHFERVLDPVVKSAEAWALKDVEGAIDRLEGRASEVVGIRALDAHTLEIRLVEPRAFFLHLMTLPLAGVGRLSGGQLVGAGPYRKVQVSREGVVLERNPTYFHPDLPRIERLEFIPVASREASVRALEEGRVDLVGGLYAGQVESVDPVQFQVVAGSTPSCWFLAFNAQAHPFSDVRVRQAIRAGLDVVGVVERFHPGARAARSLTPPEMLEGAGAPLVPRADVSAARRLLQEAGHTTLHLRLPFPTGRDTRQEDAVLFAPLIEAGLVTLSHEELRPEDFWQRVREGRCAIYRAWWIADVPDPDNFLHFLLHSAAQTVYRLGWSSAELDHLVTSARTSIDPEERASLYRQAEALLARELPLVPLFHEHAWALASTSVQGLHLHQVPPHVRFEHLWLDAG